jgi:gluconolactonase
MIVSGIPGVVAAGTKIELVQGGFAFTEGPVGTPDGGLYFAELRSTPTRIHRLEPNGEIKVFRDDTNSVNGLAFDFNGDLLGAEMGGKRIIRMDSKGNVTAVTTHTQAGEPFLRTNDLIADRRGGIYFTDPGPRPVIPGRKVFVYYLPPGSEHPLLIDDEIARPNGLTITTDGKTLIVCDTEGEIVFAFDLQSDGTATNKRPFARLHGIPGGVKSGADGMAIDRDDRLYVTSVVGIQVFDKTGQYLGTIPFPCRPINLAFSGPDKRMLYVTAMQSLYRIQMLSQGPDRLGK